MDFELTPEQEAIREAIAKICARFGDDYWLAKDKHGSFPEDFYQAIAAGGWLGICIPEEYGGAGLGITQAAIMMRTISESGGGMSAADLLKPGRLAGTGFSAAWPLLQASPGASRTCWHSRRSVSLCGSGRPNGRIAIPRISSRISS